MLSFYRSYRLEITEPEYTIVFRLDMESMDEDVKLISSSAIHHALQLRSPARAPGRWPLLRRIPPLYPIIAALIGRACLLPAALPARLAILPCEISRREREDGLVRRLYPHDAIKQSPSAFFMERGTLSLLAIS
jgi:hypothetical protein